MKLVFTCTSPDVPCCWWYPAARAGAKRL